MNHEFTTNATPHSACRELLMIINGQLMEFAKPHSQRENYMLNVKK